MELKPIEVGFIIEDATNIGIVKAGSYYFIIDAGIDKDKAKKIKKIIDSIGVSPNFLILTHHHADHTGGARALKEFYNLKVLSSRFEKVFIENPILEPLYLSQGANPKDEMLSKWVLSSSVSVDLTEDSINYEDISFIDLSGHSIGMIGVKVKNYVFSSDAFFSKEVLDKYIVPYFFDFDSFLNKMEFLKTLSFDYIVPSHGKLLSKEESIDVINYNIKRLNEIKEKILNILETEKTLCEIMKALNIDFHDEIVYTLVESSIKATLNSLTKNKNVLSFLRNGVLLYKKSPQNT